MRVLLMLVGLILRAAAAVVAVAGVLRIFDAHPYQGVAIIIAAIGLMIAGTELRSSRYRRADLSDALYIGSEDLIGYRSHVMRRHKG